MSEESDGIESMVGIQGENGNVDGLRIGCCMVLNSN
jgi:hypothetical protein